MACARQMNAGGMSFPMQALLDRLAKMDSQADSWKTYLPKDLSKMYPAEGDLKQAMALRQKCFPKAPFEEDFQRSGSSPGQHESGSVTGRVWELSQDAAGSRMVQEAMDSAKDEYEVLKIAMELQGHEWDAMQNPHGNFVLQKCIVLLKPENLDFLVRNMMSGNQVKQAARHKYACRILQRLIENCAPTQAKPLIQKVIDDFLSISCHPYGNYVAQHIIRHGEDNQRGQILDVVKSSISQLCMDSFGCNIVICFFAHAPVAEQLDLSQALISQAPLMTHMACNRFGYRAVLAVLGVVPADLKAKVAQTLKENDSMLRSCRYGRAVAAEVEQVLNFKDAAAGGA
eukprot:TRINITY_DN729_c5_g1_i1.p1 TRINITY_DN729_c5_g1~~TRINITY_DN729_c5_g1_i1.p1  ORF type:complete len:343 (-),score=77.75 TRINITY_DN729_c5_g1_i1:468-1496(-)